jgi:hypothetical protein
MARRLEEVIHGRDDYLPNLHLGPDPQVESLSILRGVTRVAVVI